MKRIIIMPIGKVDPEFLLSISAAVGTKFHTKAEVDRKMSIPPDSYNALREQYYAAAVLKEMIVLKILFIGFQYCGLTRLMPPKTGEIFITVLMISTGSFVERQIGKASITRFPTEFL